MADFARTAPQRLPAGCARTPPNGYPSQRLNGHAMLFPVRMQPFFKQLTRCEAARADCNGKVNCCADRAVVLKQMYDPLHDTVEGETVISVQIGNGVWNCLRRSWRPLHSALLEAVICGSVAEETVRNASYFRHVWLRP